MNNVTLVGRLTNDPQIRYTQGEKPMAIARYTVAVDRRSRGKEDADFIPCTVFGASAEFAEKYFRKGMRVAVRGSIKTGSYTDKEGRKVYTTEVYVDDQEFAESRGEGQGRPAAAPQQAPQAAAPQQQARPAAAQQAAAPQQYETATGVGDFFDPSYDDMPFQDD